jgi:hypothetical protein
VSIQISEQQRHIFACTWCIGNTYFFLSFKADVSTTVRRAVRGPLSELQKAKKREGCLAIDAKDFKEWYTNN